MDYPVYRRYLNGRSYFKISSPDELEELQLMGSRCFIHQLKAKILPERNFIYDLTFAYENHCEVIEAAVYEEFKAKCRG